ncbi:hypothetical protein D3C84_1107150 [compost metagenome]
MRVGTDVHLGIAALGHDLRHLGAHLLQVHGAVGLVTGVQLTAQVPVVTALGLDRQREDLLATVAGQCFAGDLGQFDLHPLGQHRCGDHENH